MSKLKLNRREFGALALGAGAAATLSTAALADTPIVIRYASPYPPDHIFSRADKAFFEKVEKETGGKVKFQAYWAGTLISDREGIAQLASGVADMAFVAPIYSRVGKDISRSMEGWFNMRLTPDQKVQVFWKLWDKYPQLRAEFEGVHLVAAHAGTNMDVMTANRAVRTLDDLKGLRLKATGDEVIVLNKLGAAAVAMPMGDVYTSLQKGILDGTIAPYETLVGFKFAEVIKYFTTFPAPRAAYGSRAMNQKSWDALPADIQKVFTANSLYWSHMVHEYSDKQDAVGKEFGKKHGVEFITPPEKDLDAYLAVQAEVYLDVAKKLDAKGLPGTAMMNDAEAWSKEILAANN